MSARSLRINNADRLMAGVCAAASVAGLMAYGPRFVLVVLPAFLCFLLMKDLRYGVFLYPLFYLFDPFAVPLIGSPPKLLSMLILVWFFVNGTLGKKAALSGAPYDAPYGKRMLGVFFLAFLYVGVISMAVSPLALKNGLLALQSIFLKGLLAYLVYRIISSRKDLHACFNFYFAMQAALVFMVFFLVLYYRQPYIMRMYQTDLLGRSITFWADKLPFLDLTLIQFPNITARALLVGLPFLAFFVRTSSGGRRTVYTALFILSCAAIFFTFSRSGILALALSVLLMALRFRSRKMAAVFLVLAMTGGYLVAGNANFDKRFKDITTGQYHKELRYAILIASWKTFRQHPLLGAGPGSEEYEISKRLGLATEHSGHNLFMNVLMEYGVAGIACFLALCAVLLKRLFSVERLMRDEEGVLLARAFQIMFITFLFASQFAPTLNDNHLWYFVGLALAFRKMSFSASESPHPERGALRPQFQLR